jgi:hypothetical protein
MYSYKQGASVRGVEFLLTEDDFRALTKQDCFYCGAPPAQAYDKGRSHAYNGMWIHNGVDRISDRGGYTTENCVPCCKACNYMKQGMDDTEFFDHIVSIHNHMESQGYECDTLGSRAELAK